MKVDNSMFLRSAAAASRMEVAKYHSGHLRKTTLVGCFHSTCAAGGPLSSASRPGNDSLVTSVGARAHVKMSRSRAYSASIARHESDLKEEKRASENSIRQLTMLVTIAN